MPLVVIVIGWLKRSSKIGSRDGKTSMDDRTEKISTRGP